MIRHLLTFAVIVWAAVCVAAYISFARDAADPNPEMFNW